MRRRVLVSFLVGLISAGSSCRRRLEVPEATYRETVTAFYTALAAMQTSQDVLARREFERVTALVPGEPAGWANLGLLLMRQQELDRGGAASGQGRRPGAEERGRAAAAAPCSRAARDACPRRSALEERGRAGSRATRRRPTRWRSTSSGRAATTALAEAQRVLESLVARSDNLAARLELARLAAKRGDAARCAGDRAARRGVAVLADAGPGAARASSRRRPPNRPRRRRAWPS